jgi:hypothetical protein
MKMMLQQNAGKDNGEKRASRIDRREISPLREPTRSQEVIAKRKGVGSLRSK